MLGMGRSGDEDGGSMDLGWSLILMPASVSVTLTLSEVVDLVAEHLKLAVEAMSIITLTQNLTNP